MSLLSVMVDMGARPQAPGIFGAMTRIHRRGLRRAIVSRHNRQKPKPSSPLPQRRMDGFHNRNETAVDSRFLCLTCQESTALVSCSVGIHTKRSHNGSGENLAHRTTQKANVDASFDPAIAWRVASQQSQPPFHRTSHNLRRFGFLIKQYLNSGGGSIPLFQSRAIHAK